MLKRLFNTLIMTLILLNIAGFAAAASGNLFNITTSGASLPQTVSFTLCLNVSGQTPLSCQNYTAQKTNLSIYTTIPHYTYYHAGIRVNTTGYTYTPGSAEANGYIPLPAISDTQGVNGTISNGSYTISGSITGLTRTGLILQNNGGNNLSINPGATTFTFSNPVADGGSYNVTIYSQPTGQTCTVSNGTGSNVTANVTTVNITCINLYTGIYAETNNNLVTYSADKGADWGYMLSPQGGWSLNNTTWAVATTSNSTMYQATGGQGTGVAGSGAATLIYSSDGVNWSQVATFPTNDDWVQSVFAVGNTIYVGTGNGYVYFSSNKGATWNSSVTPAQVPDSSTVNAIVVDANGVFYAGTAGGNIYYSQDSGQSWTSLPSQPSTGVSISSLAIDTNGTLYAVTANTTTQPQYNTAPLAGGTWQSMTALPGGDGDATTIAATGTTVYVGTSNSHVMYTSDKGVSWAGNQLPNDFSGITSLFVTQNILSPQFVESYGVMQLTSSQGTGTVTVKNLSDITVSNVHADSTQLPANVTQTSSPCTSVVSGGTCSITFTANGTNGFSPTAFNIIDNNENTISRAALVSSITPNGGTNYYYVYNVNGGIASVIDAGNVSNGIIWGSNGTTVNYTSIWGIAENSTTTVPYPNATQPAGQSATQYTGQQNCHGATDGACDSTNIYIYYNNFIAGHPIPTSDYAEGLCYANTHGGTPGTGQWYLPSACELNGGIYFNLTTHQFVSCSPVLTGYFSLYSLGALGGPLNSLLSTGYYWSSTEQSFSPQYYVSGQNFVTGGGGNQGGNAKGTLGGIRCSRALTI